jgi:hypothetical protein
MPDTLTGLHLVTTVQDGSGRYNRSCLCGWSGAVWTSRDPSTWPCPQDQEEG